MAARSIGRRPIFRRLKFEGLSKFFFPKQIYNNCVAKWWAFIYFHTQKYEEAKV